MANLPPKGRKVELWTVIGVVALFASGLSDLREGVFSGVHRVVGAGAVAALTSDAGHRRRRCPRAKSRNAF